ncbi:MULTISPECIES: hypothetical protein [Sphingomonas]|uniref:Lysozyme inhibitor LprI N-terminal domain-containing protein n=1 Tax=Sphingomonas kyungheensis TaxID=1069987 RepID=A0ABU8H5P7_9SPHN|nr:MULTISPECIES: hypothetical protein [unclassified Sphingomonas]EZP48716.1 hypothetical protein BW41_04021 [Sphingomonas sp. RIT328]
MESYYRDQATICAEQASATSLPNVIARLRRSEAAWLAMADRAARHTEIKAAKA